MSLFTSFIAQSYLLRRENFKPPYPLSFDPHLYSHVGKKAIVVTFFRDRTAEKGSQSVSFQGRSEAAASISVAVTFRATPAEGYLISPTNLLFDQLIVDAENNEIPQSLNNVPMRGQLVSPLACS